MPPDESIEGLRCKLSVDQKAFTAAMYALDFQQMRSVLSDMRERVQVMFEIKSAPIAPAIEASDG